MSVQQNVAEYLHDKGIKKTFLSKKTGINQSRLSRILNGGLELKADELKAICHALDVSPSVFIDN